MQGWQGLATISLLVSKLFFYYPCDQPVAYRLGNIDPRFKLSQTQAQKDIDAATHIWGQQHFQLDPEAKLSVNFIYDQRQSLVTQINSSESQITTNKAALEAKISAFNAKARDFEQQVAALNAEIADWNRKGGAPEDVYQQLTARQQQLSATRQSLQAEVAALNQAAKNFNLQVNELNVSIDSFNDLIVLKPEEGLYDAQQQTIEIYFVNTRDELVHTLAHEFGHARSLNHVDNPKGIMNASSSQTLTTTPEDLAELERACTRISKFQILTQLLRSKLD